MSLTPTPADALLSLAPGVGQRSGSFSFELIDGGTGQHLGMVHPDRDSVPSLDHDTSRTIKRTISGLRLAEADDVNPVTDRVKLAHVAGDGTVHPLSTYLFADSTLARRSANSMTSGALFDLMGVLDHPREHAFSARIGVPVQDAILDLLAESEIDAWRIDSSDAIFGAPFAQPAGTSGAKILDDLATLGGYFPSWIDNNSELRLTAAFDPADLPVGIDYDASGGVIDGTIAETSDLIKAPNRFIVIDSGNRHEPLVGVYDIPASAPHSRQKRGFTLAQTTTVQGLASQGQADATARTIGLAATLFERVEFSTPPDPRHDAYDVVRYAGVNWLEVAWSMQLAETGDHRHRVRKIYS